MALISPSFIILIFWILLRLGGNHTWTPVLMMPQYRVWCVNNGTVPFYLFVLYKCVPIKKGLENIKKCLFGFLITLLLLSPTGDQNKKI